MKEIEDARFMSIAIEEARIGIQNGQTPFGACIVKDNEVISVASNSVWKDMDITAHAEINAIRQACKKLHSIELTGCTIYSTTEPCPMCFSACHWARISRIVFGSRIEDAKRFGFSEMPISNEKMKSMGDSRIEITGDVIRDICIELFEVWSFGKDKKKY